VSETTIMLIKGHANNSAVGHIWCSVNVP